jgi:putative flippase GtrA
VLEVPGRRYEYELNLLLRARSADVDIDTVPIATIYLDDNAASHFRPVIDSARIYWPLLKFGLSSALAFVIDTVALLVLHAVTGSLLVSVIGARVLSATVNYLINRRVVFTHGRRLPMVVTAARYFALVAGLLLANYALLALLTSVGLGLLRAKVLTEVALFGVSYAAQRALVFGARPGCRDGDAQPGR